MPSAIQSHNLVLDSKPINQPIDQLVATNQLIDQLVATNQLIGQLVGANQLIAQLVLDCDWIVQHSNLLDCTLDYH